MGCPVPQRTTFDPLQLLCCGDGSTGSCRLKNVFASVFKPIPKASLLHSNCSEAGLFHQTRWKSTLLRVTGSLIEIFLWLLKTPSDVYWWCLCGCKLVHPANLSPK